MEISLLFPPLRSPAPSPLLSMPLAMTGLKPSSFHPGGPGGGGLGDKRTSWWGVFSFKLQASSFELRGAFANRG